MHELSYWGKKLFQASLRTPLPRILIVCIGLVFLVSLIPLVLTLFVVFLLLKLLLLLVVLTVRKQRNNPAELDFSRRTYGRK
jgi:Flp pilus assembly protein TadB